MFGSSDDQRDFTSVRGSAPDFCGASHQYIHAATRVETAESNYGREVLVHP